MQLESAYLHYGVSRYPINLTDSISELPSFAPLEGEFLDRACDVVARATGLFGGNIDGGIRWVKSRITHNVAIDEQRYTTEQIPALEHDLVIPRSVQLLGNGFSLVWKD